MTAIAYRDVGFAYPGGEPVLDALELDVHAGEILLVAGPSGSGKSTLLRCANGLVPHASGGRFRGDVVAFGRSTRSHPPRRLADVVGFVHQHPESQFVIDRVESDIAFVLENLGMAQVAMRRRVEEVLDALGIAHLRDRSPATLSGGEQQRCALAGALAAAPSALVLDEPTSQLDPQGAEDVLAAVARLNADLGTTVFIAEHRLERAAPLAHRALLFTAGAIGGTTVAPGPVGEVLSSYAGAPSVTRLGRLLGWDPPPLTVRHARDHARAHPPHLGRLPDRVEPAPGEVLLSAAGLRAVLGGRAVLKGVDIEVRRGEIVALLGRNGSGKTTLLRTLAGLARADGGQLQRPGTVAYVPQDPDTLLLGPTVRADVAATCRLLGIRDPGRVEHWLEALDIGPLAERHPRDLSAGERQRVAIAAIAVGDPDVLLLDEPTRGMDAPSRVALENLLAARVRSGDGGIGGAAVLATHDVELAARCATRVVVLGDGDVVADGPARSVLEGSLFAPQVLRVLAPFLTVEEVAAALEYRGGGAMSTGRAGLARPRPVAVYVLAVAVGAAAFLYPFWLPAEALPSAAHGGDAPLVAAAVGALVVAAVTLELRRGTMNGASVALLGVLSAMAGLLRLVDLPGGGSGIFFLVILAGAAFGPRFGLLLGFCAMATSALITGGIGPWLPFQMLALGWMGGASGFAGRLTQRLPGWGEVALLAGFGWAAGFFYGAVMNLWFWPFTVGTGALSWHPGLSLSETLQRYWSFYVVTSFPWDTAGALTNAVLILLTGRRLLQGMRRVAHRLEPVVELVAFEAPAGDESGRDEGGLAIEAAFVR